MTYREYTEGQAQKFFEEQTVFDLIFQFGVEGDAKPFLQQQAFE